MALSRTSNYAQWLSYFRLLGFMRRAIGRAITEERGWAVLKVLPLVSVKEQMLALRLDLSSITIAVGHSKFVGHRLASISAFVRHGSTFSRLKEKQWMINK